jgi:hypothetical protein
MIWAEEAPNPYSTGTGKLGQASITLAEDSHASIVRGNKATVNIKNSPVGFLKIPLGGLERPVN